MLQIFIMGNRQHFFPEFCEIIPGISCRLSVASLEILLEGLTIYFAILTTKYIPPTFKTDIFFIACMLVQCWKSSPSSTEFLPSKWDGAKYSSPYLCSPWMDFDFQGGYGKLTLQGVLHKGMGLIHAMMARMQMDLIRGQISPEIGRQFDEFFHKNLQIFIFL